MNVCATALQQYFLQFTGHSKWQYGTITYSELGNIVGCEEGGGGNGTYV
jgi:hypothetical protein